MTDIKILKDMIMMHIRDNNAVLRQEIKNNENFLSLIQDDRKEACVVHRPQVYFIRPVTKELKLEVGKTYRTRAADKIYIYNSFTTSIDDSGLSLFLGTMMQGVCVLNSDGFFNSTWKSNGLYHESNGCHKYDIVAEWED